jgi:hypothetical protein
MLDRFFEIVEVVFDAPLSLAIGTGAGEQVIVGCG